MINFNFYEHLFGSISGFSCLLVVLTYILFKDIRNLRYIELGTYVAINNLIGSLGLAIGRQKNKSLGCVFQVITTNANYLSAIFWVVIITYQVWLVVIYGKILKNMLICHIICWILPIILTLLPLMNTTYANTDDQGISFIIYNL